MHHTVIVLSLKPAGSDDEDVKGGTGSSVWTSVHTGFNHKLGPSFWMLKQLESFVLKSDQHHFKN